ncbi:serine protease [Pseudonocardia spinosispora]|uniref:serine protease n=1 Tax=Pseudonocardia spinosispora TaxID=103441 RepID=UPI00041B20B3|nr:serine protease [Pseudonocardia spinosispora]
MLGVSVVRIHRPDGEVLGAGFIVAPGLVATCAHVVAEALDADPESGSTPAGTLTLTFPLVTRCTEVTARVSRWSPMREDGSGDVALLELAAQAPSEATVPPMLRPDDVSGREYRVLGFPTDLRDGEWATGQFLHVQGSGWLQLRPAPGSPRLVHGFSGAPVWDVESRAVVGMAVAARTDGPASAFAMPIQQVLGIDPTLLPNPYRGLEPFDEHHAEFFHGRDADIDRVLCALSRSPVVAVTGGSGVGKSSLLYAGVLPRLRERGARIGQFRTVGATSAARMLAGALAPVLEPTLVEESAGTYASALSQQLERDLPAVASRLRTRVGEAELVMVADQFEELAADRPEDARALLRMLAQLVEAHTVDGRRRMRVLVTLRWAAMIELPSGPLADMLDEGTVVLRTMGRAQLREAIVAPSVRAPGLYFEPGLVDRILDDTGEEPGRLPLLESLLAQLWEQRDGGVLRASTYEQLGGVHTAIARRAEQVWAELTAPEERAAAWRVLTLLVKPSASDQFLRTSRQLGSLPATLRPVARKLAARRLIVITADADGSESLELAHQALIDHWPQFRARLTEDREFLTWRRELQRHRQNWLTRGRESAALLTGGALRTAREMTETRPDDIPGVYRDYVRASVAHQRRGVRRRALAGAAVAALVVCIVVAGLQLRDANRQVDARILASNSSRETGDPSFAAQLALAAFRADPSSPEARTALGRAYLAIMSVGAVLTDVADKPIDHLVTGPETDTVLVPQGNGYAVVTSLSTSPNHWKPPELPIDGRPVLTPDGRRVLAVDQSNRLLSWNVADHTGPDVLTDLDLPPLAVSSAPAVSADSTRAVWITSTPDGPPQVHIWDLRTNQGVPHQISISPGVTVSEAWLTDDPARIALRYGDPQSPDTRLVIRDVASGAELRSLAPGSAIARQGTLVVGCDPTISIVRASDGTPALSFPGLEGTSCVESTRGTVSLSGDREYLRSYSPGLANDSHSLVTIYSLSDGRQYPLFLPPSAYYAQDKSPFRPLNTLGAIRDGSGRPVPIIADGQNIYRLEPPPGPVGTATPAAERRPCPLPADAPAAALVTRLIMETRRNGPAPSAPVDCVISPDGQHLAFVDDTQRIQLWDMASGTRLQRLSLFAPHLLDFDGAGELVISSSDGIFLWNADGARVGPIGLLGSKDIDRLTPDRLSLVLPFSDTTIPLEPRRWFERICAAQNRPFTALERSVLPLGVGTDPPCEADL